MICVYADRPIGQRFQYHAWLVELAHYGPRPISRELAVWYRRVAFDTLVWGRAK